jgi:hypothetical protein
MPSMPPNYSRTLSLSIPVKFYRSPAGRWIGVAEMSTPTGIVRLTASADEATIRASMMAAARMQFMQAKRAGASAGFLGGLFKRIGKIASSAVSVVSNLARGRIAAALKSAVSLAREGLPVVALAIPGLGVIAATSITVASSLLSRAKKGDPTARAALARNAEAARRGDPAALKRQRILRAVAMKSGAIRRRRLAAMRARRNAVDPMLQGIAGGGGMYSIHGDDAAAGFYSIHGDDAAAGFYSMAGADLGTWTTAIDGQKVFTPAAMAGGIIWDQLKPHLGYRSGPSSYITSRSAYHGGLAALAQMRR